VVVAARAVAIPPPIGGWDTLNALADMPPENASQLDNWFPDADKVSVRRGFTAWSTGYPSPVETIMPYVPPSGASKMFAASGTGVYDATANGAVGAAVLSGKSNARWQWAQMTTAGGHFLTIVNGVDTPQIWNGTAWANTGITGPTVANLVWINVHQRRMWVGEVNSLRGWYLAPNAVSGAALSFDFTGLASLGGYLVGMGTWTRDGGSGPDDLAVFLTSEGEALIYTGTDPASADTWALVGIFRLGRPLGRRCMIRAGADLLVMTDLGFVALSDVLPVDRAQQSAAAFSKQISPTVAAAARLYSGSFGWQAFIYPSGSMAIFNVPSDAGTFDQFVFNTITKKPCRFKGMNARCWGLLNDNAYFGGSDAVYLSDDGFSDDGADIVAMAVQAPNDFGSGAQKKAFKSARVVVTSEVAPSLGVDVALDYRVQNPPPAPVDLAASLALWDVALWDVGLWAGEAVFDPRRGLRGVGRTGSIRVQAASSVARPSWIRTIVSYIPGGL
jgi:hypothetical protein